MKYIILCLLILGCSDPSKLNHRISKDKTEEILYLQENIALLRMFMKNAVLTLEGGIDKDIFTIVKAHWLNKPTLSRFTGDRIDETLVRDVGQIGKSSTGEAFYGKGKLYSGDWQTLPEDIFFVLYNTTVKIYKSESEFIQKLKEYGVNEVEMISPSRFMSMN